MTARKTGIIVGAVAGISVAAAAVAGVGLRLPDAAAAGSEAGAIQPSTRPLFAPPKGAPLSFADLFDKVSPAVVSIDVTSRADPRVLAQIPGLGGRFQMQPDPGEGQDGNDGGSGGKGDGAAPKGGRGPRQQASGSGFFISGDGYIVTNNHVVENAEEISVTLKDGRELKAKLVGRDEGTDLAVIKVEGKGFKYVSFENAAKPRVGDWVITIGNPFGLGGTATAGIVSAFGRDLGDTAFVDYIQIDAPINRGNSGGPTFDVYGRVIGVNSAIVSPTGGSVGIGFAIPAEIADNVTKQLMNGGKITRGYMGAQIQDFTAEMGDALGLSGQKGALITNLTPGGPAAKAGVQPRDIVVSVNGQPVRSSSELTRQVSRARPGETIRLEIIRGGSKKIVNVISGTRPGEKELARGLGANDDNDSGGPATPEAPALPKGQILGLGITTLDPAGRQRHSIPDEVSGVLVTGADADSDAGEIGFGKGDVISSINNVPVNTPAEAQALVDEAKKAGREKVLLGYFHAGRSGYLTVKITP